MACKLRYTVSEFLAIMAIGFVQGELPPSVDKDGKPTYVIQRVSATTIASGCAATLVIQATANEAFLKNVSSLGTHESCSISGMPSKGINIWDILDMPMNPLARCHAGHKGFQASCGYCERTRSAIIEFFQDLQNCHDEAAKWYIQSVAAGFPEADCLAGFRKLVLANLKKVAAKNDIPWTSVETDIITYAKPLAERVPAIRGRTSRSPVAV